MKISDNKRKTCVSSLTERVESGEISSSISGSDESFVTCLSNSDKIAKPIKILLGSFY